MVLIMTTENHEIAMKKHNPLFLRTLNLMNFTTFYKVSRTSDFHRMLVIARPPHTHTNTSCIWLDLYTEHAMAGQCYRSY